MYYTPYTPFNLGNLFWLFLICGLILLGFLLLSSFFWEMRRRKRDYQSSTPKDKTVRDINNAFFDATENAARKAEDANVTPKEIIASAREEVNRKLDALEKTYGE